MIKYPIEIELTNHCGLQCISCISKDIKERWFIKLSKFDIFISFLQLNYNNIEFLTIWWFWDNFLHPKIDLILDKLLKLKWYNIPIVFPTKAISINEKMIKKIKLLKKEWLNINLQIWIFSLREDISNFLCWLYNPNTKCFNLNYYEIFKEKIRILKTEWVDFSLELLLTKFSENEISYFYSFCESLGVEGVVHKLHNFGWRLKTYNFLYSNVEPETKSAWIRLKDTESVYYRDLCPFYPFIDYTGKVYPGSFCIHYKLWDISLYNFKWWMEAIVNKCYKIINLKNPFCKKCSENPLFNN